MPGTTDDGTGSSYSTRPTFVILAVAASAYAMLQALVIPVLGTLQHALDTTAGPGTWIVTSYLLAACVSTPVVGRLGDVWGQRGIFIVSMFVLCAGSLVCGIAHTLPIMIVGRVVQGLGGGGVLPLCFGIARAVFPENRVGGVVGSIASLTAVGTGLGQGLTGPIVDVLDYHWLFWLSALVTGVAGAAAMQVLPRMGAGSGGRVSVLPGVLLAAWLSALLVGFIEGPYLGWASPVVVSSLVASPVLFGVWLAVEAHAAHPVIDVNLLRRRAMWSTSMVALLLGFGLYAMFAFLPQMIQTTPDHGYGFGLSVTTSGLIVAASSVAQLLVAIAASRLVVRFGGRSLLFWGCLIDTATLLAVAFAHDSQPMVLAEFVAFGVGTGLAISALAGLVVTSVAQHETGVASGLNTNVRTIGGAVGTALMASIVGSHLDPTGVPRESGYTTGFFVLSAILLLSALATWLVPVVRSPRPASAAELSAASLGLPAGAADID